LNKVKNTVNNTTKVAAPPPCAGAFADILTKTAVIQAKAGIHGLSPLEAGTVRNTPLSSFPSRHPPFNSAANGMSPAESHCTVEGRIQFRYCLKACANFHQNTKRIHFCVEIYYNEYNTSDIMHKIATLHEQGSREEQQDFYFCGFAGNIRLRDAKAILEETMDAATEAAIIASEEATTGHENGTTAVITTMTPKGAGLAIYAGDSLGLLCMFDKDTGEFSSLSSITPEDGDPNRGAVQLGIAGSLGHGRNYPHDRFSYPIKPDSNRSPYCLAIFSDGCWLREVYELPRVLQRVRHDGNIAQGITKEIQTTMQKWDAKGADNRTAIVIQPDPRAKEIFFGGVFDGHGPEGHLVAEAARDACVEVIKTRLAELGTTFDQGMSLAK
jgi:serine/threonine protein phosphatase PrpC